MWFPQETYSKLETEQSDETYRCSLAIRGRGENFQWSLAPLQGPIELQLLLHLEKLFLAAYLLGIICRLVQASDYGECFLWPVLLEQPTGRKWKPWRSHQEDQSWHALES